MIELVLNVNYNKGRAQFISKDANNDYYSVFISPSFLIDNSFV